MHHATFATPCLTTFCRLDELGLEAVGQHLEPDLAVLAAAEGERGVFTFEGRMVDEPVLRHARSLLRRA